MPVISYSITCTRKIILAPEVYEFAFTKPEGFTFKPGQFVLFDVPLIDNPSDVQTRAFSLASTPGEAELLYVIKLVKGGRASRWFDECVEVGTTVTIKGPFGNFLLDAEEGIGPLFLATGTGLAPFRSQIVDALQRSDSRRMDLIFGVKREEDLFWVKEFEELAQRYPSFFLHISLTDGSPAWTGHRGRVQAVAPGIVREFVERSVYACGNPNMTKEVKKLALEQWGVDKKLIHVEGYI